MLIVLLSMITSCNAANYQRGEYTYTIKNSATAEYFGKQCSPTQNDEWFVTEEIASINHKSSFTKGDVVKLPVYVKSNKFFVGDVRNWHVAVVSGHKYDVNPALLIAIRSHENPSPSADYKCCGVKYPSGGWWPGGIWGQYGKAADIAHRRAIKWGCDATQPSHSFIDRLGEFYAEGSTEWGDCVNVLFQRARR
jgi:hypothetical protein